MTSVGVLAMVVATVANVATNVFIRLMMETLPPSFSPRFFLLAMHTPWFWCAAASGVVLVTSFALAVRTLDLAVAYAVVVGGALVLLTGVAWIGFAETPTPLRLVGIGCIVVGIALVGRG